MLHIVSTMMFLGAGTFSVAIVIAMLTDNAPSIARALNLYATPAPLPARAGRVRVLRSPRLVPMSPVRTRSAA